MNREQLFRYFFIGALLFLVFQLLHILSPFYTGILGAIVLSLIFFPTHRWMNRKLGGTWPNLAALLTTLLVLVLIIIPFVVSTWLMFRELITLQPAIKHMESTLASWRLGESATNSRVLQILETQLATVLDIAQVDLKRLIVELIDKGLFTVSTILKQTMRNSFLFIINMMIMVITLFFLFRDGPNVFRRIKELIPMDNKHKENIAALLYVTVTAIVRGVFIVAGVQGILAGIGFMIVKSSAPVMLAFCTMAAALVPMFGAASVWIPVCVYYLLQNDLQKALFLLLWGGLIVSLADNVLRTIIIGTKAKLPILLLFFGLLGGIKIYGPLGLFLGPLVIALLLAFIKIYREEYSQAQKDTPS